MTSKQYLTLKNRLMSLACCVNVYSREYANLNRRIRICGDKAYQAKSEFEAKYFIAE